MANGGGGVAWLALVAAAGALGLAIHAGRKAGPGKGAESEVDLLDAKSLEGRLHDVEGRLEESQKRLTALEERFEKVSKDAAEASAQARNATRILAEKGGAAAVSPAEDEAGRKASEEEKRVEGERLLAVIRDGQIPEGGVFAMFNRLRDIGYLDKALAELEKYAKAHADDADTQVELAGAYIVKLMAVPDGMERGAWSMKSLAACEEALRSQPEHWGAQYMKGMNLSQWPAFLGKQPEAIKTFEKLIEQQERGAPEARYAQSYYQLGNTYRSAGNMEKARKVFARGLEIFPEDKQLREQLELLDKK